MSARGRANGGSGPAKPERRGAAGNGKMTDSEPVATATSGLTTAARSPTPAARRAEPRRAKPTSSPRRPDSTNASASDTVGRRRSDRVSSRRVRPAETANSAARNRVRKENSSGSVDVRSRDRTRLAESSLSEYGGATNAPLGQEAVAAVVESLKAYVRQLLDAVRDRGEELTKKIQEWMDTLIEAVAHGGAGMQAGLAGIRAAAAGKNPVLAAIKGFVSGLSGPAKVGLVLLLTLGLLLGPVVLVVLLLVLVVAALVAAVRPAAE
jgi:hypothetical protein